MLRVAVVAAAAGCASAGLLAECKQGLHQLQGKSDFELAAQCRATFAPEVCRQARRHLGAQPWSAAKIEESCSKFAIAFDGKDVRSLEQAVAAKGTSSVDAAVAPKAPAPAPAFSPPTEAPKKGLVASLLDKLKQGKKEDKPTEAPKKGFVGNLLDKLKEGKKDDKPTEAPKKGLVGNLLDKLKEGKKDDKPAQKPPPAKLGPVAAFVKKMQDDKLAEQRRKPAKESLLGELLKGKPAKLYDDEQQDSVQKPKVNIIPGAVAGGVALAAMAVVVVRRARVGSVTPTVEEVE